MQHSWVKVGNNPANVSIWQCEICADCQVNVVGRLPLEGCAGASRKMLALMEFCAAFNMRPEDLQEAINLWAEARISSQNVGRMVLNLPPLKGS